MICPGCGDANQASGAYCRRCGEWVARGGARGRDGGSPRDRLGAMTVFNALSAVFALTSAIILYATYLGTPEAKWSIYVAAAFCLVITVHQAVSFAFALQLKARLGRGRDRTSDEDASGAVHALPGFDTSRFVDVPSVTESTTDLLPGRAETSRSLDTGELDEPRRPAGERARQ